MADKHIYIIAGPNGAGKTTFAIHHLASRVPTLHFVNADLIAAGLSPLDRGAGMEATAGRLMLEEINRLAAQGRSFAFETTLAGRSYLRRIEQWRRDGYRVLLMYLMLDSPQDAMQRVEQRIRQGGHGVPEPVILRRFYAGLQNLREFYIGKVDEWMVFDNSRSMPVLIAQGTNND
ncbi:MAG: zeta toxin family protein [bacterium]|nr:zeta toxin family protein [bacterium]